MKKYSELTYDERTEIKALFANWLKEYSHETIKKVMAKSEEIINNEFTMNMLRELATRENKELYDFTNSIGSMLDDYEMYKAFNPHNHVLEHADAYRKVLYDMYIRGYNN